MPLRWTNHLSRRWAVALLVAALLAGYYALCLTATRQECCTFDEIAHVTAGYTYWKTGQFRLQPENGNLPQRLAGAALLGLGPKLPATDSILWHDSSVWQYGAQFFYHQGNDADALLLRSRAAIALLGVATGLLVFLWSRQLFGLSGALLSLTLFTFCPSMLAHGGLATSDMAATLFFPAAVYALWRLLHRVSLGTILLAGACLAGLFLSKMSAGLGVVMGALLALIRIGHPAALPLCLPGKRGVVRARLWRAALLAAVAVVLMLLVWGAIWAAYGFRYSAFGPDPDTDMFAPAGWGHVLNRPGLSFDIIAWARDYRLLPEAYLYGHAYVFHDAQFRSAFLDGARSVTGWWWFFPYCLAVKTPLALFGILVLAGAATAWRWAEPSAPPDSPHPALPARPWWRAAGAGFYAAAPLWVLLAVYWTACLFTHLNIGHRHILPTYPAMFVLAGAAGLCLAQRHWVRYLMAGLLAALLVWFIGASLFIRPHYLAYFNETVGGPRQGYRHLVDSSLDWGQDLPGLRQYLDSHGLNQPGETRVYVSYFGTGDLACYGIHARLLPGYPPAVESADARRLAPPLTGGCYGISATMLQAIYLSCAGAWKPEYEAQYQMLKKLRADLSAQLQDPAQARAVEESGSEYLLRVNLAYRDLMFGRLCAYLRQHRREHPPDDEVGYSILIYHLTDQEVDAALSGPPAEWWLGPPEMSVPR